MPEAMRNLISEETLKEFATALGTLVESAGAIIIFLGAAIAFARFLYVIVVVRTSKPFAKVRLDLGRFLALGLEFQLAGDILRTAASPTLREIGILAAIAAIRTALNFFLAKEIKEERREVEESLESPTAAAAAAME